jgi:aconitate hydratase
MTRGTFANVRIKNLMVPGIEGGYTLYFGEKEVPAPDKEITAAFGKPTSIYDACMAYKNDGVPLIVIAGQEYGTGSSRDWAAKGTSLLGVKAVVAQSFERIHRSNLCGMGVLPLQFPEGVTAQTLGLDGSETFDVLGLSNDIQPRQDVTLRITRRDGSTLDQTVRLRIDTPIEIDYYRHGGILPFVLGQLLAG